MKPINRRDFIKTTGAITSILAISSPLYAFNSINSHVNSNELFQLFQIPPAQAKPFYRWWWNGNRVTKQEVVRELEIMHDAGAGGVEINPIALNEAILNPTGEALEWLSDEWIDILKASIEKGKDLGMITDLIIGTGWPFGGKFLSDEETIQGHDIYIEKVSGPSKYIFNTENLNKGATIKQAKLIPVPVNNLDEVQDITNEIISGNVNIPSGNFEVAVVSWRNKFRDVMHGAPGGDGPVLDHYSKTAVEKYLNRTSEGLKPALGENLGTSIRSMFCDSIELSGANWTGDFRKEFENRKGYDVWEYLPLILNGEIKAEGDFADTLLRVRFDYYSTLSALFMERFILPFHNWCRKVGVKSRYQAYGHPWVPTDLLAGNLVPDIPEGDQWLFNGGWTATQIDEIRYAIWDKYTSSAAHLRGLKIASCEAMTNTSGVFSASLEYIKQATDINFVAGINHFVLHGWNYSPPEAGFPGWIRYGTYFNEKNPWFPYLKLWSDYTARLSAVFQNSQAVCQVAIMGPTADRWSEKGLDREPFLTQPWYLHSLWQAMNHHGYCSDYLNPRIFEEATYENGNINYGPMSYQALMVCDMQMALPGFIDSLVKYAEAGGKIIFIGKTPSKSPGMKFKGDNSVFKKLENFLAKFPDTISLVNSPSPGDLRQFTKWTGEILSKNNIQPGVKISLPHEHLYIYQAENEGNPVYFFSNQNRNGSIAFEATFEAKGLIPWKWNAETGEKKQLFMKDNTIQFGLSTLESMLVVFSVEKEPETEKKIANTQMQIDILDLLVLENWTAECIPVEGKPFTIKLKELKDLSQITETKTFGGTIIYRNTISYLKKNASKLNLGKVAETAEVTLNGINLGVKWWGEKIFDISNASKEGENKLEIKVSTLLWNYCNSKTMEENPMAKLWADRNRRKDNKPLQTGLIGPVTIS